MNLTILIINIALTIIGAVVDYAALPIFVKKYSKPDSDQERVKKVGRLTISALVGLYTLLAMISHTKDSIWMSILLSAYLLIDISFSVIAITKAKKISAD